MNIWSALIIIALISCNTSTEKNESKKAVIPLQGTWKLLSGTTIEKGDSTVTDYTKGQEFIKIINDTHFRGTHFIMWDLLCRST